MNSKLLKKIKITIVIIISLVVVAAAYVGYIYFSYTRIDDNQELDTKMAGAFSYFEGKEPLKIGEFYNIVTYNIGFGAYTVDYSFFMDGGQYSWALSKEGLEANICEIAGVINRAGADFVLLQEVDVDGTRSYHVDELGLLNQFLKGYYYNDAVCYDTKFLLYPVWQPHGANKCEQITYSKAPISKGIRRSLPVDQGFSKLFDLDRCYIKTEIPTVEKENLVIYNVHLSAYSNNAEMKNAQLDKLFADMESEYKKGNYVICGGDFNRDLKREDKDVDYSWSADFPVEMLPKGFSLASDIAKDQNIKHNSCRDANEPYNPDTTFTVTTDGFLVSNNIKVNYYINGDWGYEYSDHDPVMMQIALEPKYGKSTTAGVVDLFSEPITVGQDALSSKEDKR